MSNRVLWLSKSNFSSAQEGMIKRLMGRIKMQSAGVFFTSLHKKVPNLLIKKGKTKDTWILNDEQKEAGYNMLDAFINQLGWFYIVGGMRKEQEVSADVTRFKPGQGRPCESQAE